MRTKRAFSRFLAVGGWCGLVSALVPAARAADFSAWPRKMQITFAGYDRQEAITNFPALVVLTNQLAGHFNYSDMASPHDGADLRFSAADGKTELPCEIDTWDPDGRSFIWVRVPTLAATNDCIFAYWGNPAATTPPDYTTNGSVWPDSYLAVWHLGGKGSTRPDATTNGFAGILDAGGVAATGDGMIGGADLFTGTGQKYPAVGGIDCGNVSVTGSQTIEMWINVANLSQRRNPVNKAYGGESTMTIEPAGTVNYYCGTSGTDGGSYYSVTSSSGSIVPNRWIHLALVRDLGPAKKMTWYIDGQPDVSKEIKIAAAAVSTRMFTIGKGYVYCFNGLLDEIRVSTSAYSSNRIWACWMNTASNASFQTYSPCNTLLPVVVNESATVLSVDAALLAASLISTGLSATAVTAYWGPTDGGTNTADWAYSATVDAPQEPGRISVPVDHLTPETTWYYRFAASNEGGTTWADASDWLITGELVLNLASNADEVTLSPGAFTLTRPAATVQEALTVRYRQTGGTATAGVDYVALAGEVVLPAGETTATIPVQPLKHHAVNADTTLTLSLTNTAAILGESSRATLTILNEPVVLTVLATNITRTLFGTNNAVIYADMLDAGSTASPTTIAGLRLSSPDDLTPELADRVTLPPPATSSNDFAVTLEVVDTDGNTAAASATVTLLRVESGYGAYTWNGAGVKDGTLNPCWLRGDNWLVGGILPASPPGVDDDATISLNQPFTNAVNPNYAIEIGAGATARNVTFRNMNTDGRMVEFQGDATFSTLDYAVNRNTLNIKADVTLTLTGGELNPANDAVIRSTFISPGAYSVYNILEFPGKIRCTGNQVVLRLNGVAGDIFIDDPLATVHFRGTTITMGGNLYVYDTQRVIGLNATSGMRLTRHSFDLYSQNGNALTNWAGCHIVGVEYGMTTGAPFTLPGGTYASVFVGYRGHYAGDFWYDISGDVTFCGANASGCAVEVQRRRLTYANGARFALNGNNLTVTGGGLILVGEFTNPDLPYETRNTDPLWWNRIEAEDSTVTTDGDIGIGPGGYFTSDAGTVIAFGGNWDNRSQWRSNDFDLAAATLKVNGAATPRAPQNIEAQSVDRGPTPEGLVNNHAVGRLEIGAPGQPTHARLIDADDFTFDGAPDAFYVGELLVHEGSSLDVCGLELYVDGQSVRRHWSEFGAGKLFDSTYTSGSVIFLR